MTICKACPQELPRELQIKNKALIIITIIKIPNQTVFSTWKNQRDDHVCALYQATRGEIKENTSINVISMLAVI